MMIEIPDTTKASGLTKVRGVWSALYYVDGKPRRKSLGVKGHTASRFVGQQFYDRLVREGATVRKRKVADKLKDKPDLYIYHRDPYFCQIKGKVIASGKTKKEVMKARDEYLKNEHRKSQ